MLIVQNTSKLIFFKIYFFSIEKVNAFLLLVNQVAEKRLY